jgi:hypothetical protein
VEWGVFLCFLGVGVGAEVGIEKKLPKTPLLPATCSHRDMEITRKMFASLQSYTVQICAVFIKLYKSADVS